MGTKLPESAQVCKKCLRQAEMFNKLDVFTVVEKNEVKVYCKHTLPNPKKKEE